MQNDVLLMTAVNLRLPYCAVIGFESLICII